MLAFVIPRRQFSRSAVICDNPLLLGRGCLGGFGNAWMRRHGIFALLLPTLMIARPPKGVFDLRSRCDRPSIPCRFPSAT